MKAPAETPVIRWRAVCAYDGGKFHGWQSQTNAVGVQDVIEAALAKILGAPSRIHGSGRTDTGVHALAQVFHFDAAWRHSPAKLLAALGTGLPRGVQVKTLTRARRDFHARFDATGKRYHYRIFLGRADPFTEPFCWSVTHAVNLTAMRTAARRLVGKHDFAAFCAWNGDERETTVRHLRRLDVRQRGRHVRVVLEADGFLYKMARTIVGALIAIGLGRITAGDVAALLESKSRVPAVATAPAQGLFLEKVYYK